MKVFGSDRTHCPIPPPGQREHICIVVISSLGHIHPQPDHSIDDTKISKNTVGSQKIISDHKKIIVDIVDSVDIDEIIDIFAIVDIVVAI